MHLALDQARAAARAGEVPIGAVLVNAQGQVLASAHNAPIARCDPTAHAEVLALRQGAQALGNYRLTGCTLYVSAEPCAMCAGAALHARLARVVYATAEPKTGAAGSQIDVFGHPALNAHTTVQGGVLAHEAQALLREFFSQQRQQAQARRPPRLRDDAVRAPASAFQAAFATLGWPGDAAEWRSEGHEPDHEPNGPGAEHATTGQISEPPPAASVLQAASLPTASLLQAFGHAIGLNPAANKPAQPSAWRMHAVHRPVNALPPDAPLAVLVHGWADHGWVWRDWAQALNASGWRVLVPDLLGAGQSDKPKRATRLSQGDIAHALAQLAHRLHWASAQRRVLVADASMASWLAPSAIAQSASAVLWLQAPALGHSAGQPDESGQPGEQPCSPSTPHDVSALRALLPTLDAQASKTEYAQLCAENQAAMAPYPDKGHLTQCRTWLQALCAPRLEPGQEPPTAAVQAVQAVQANGPTRPWAIWPPAQPAPLPWAEWTQRAPHEWSPPALTLALSPPIQHLRDVPTFGRRWPLSPAAAQWFADLP